MARILIFTASLVALLLSGCGEASSPEKKESAPQSESAPSKPNSPPVAETDDAPRAPAPTDAEPPAAGGEQPSEESAATPPPPPSAPAPAPGAPAPDATGWDIVPVYFGTDRAQDEDPNRLTYGSKRGRRLELGRALITVPKTHIVPAVERPWAIRIPYLDVTLYEEAEDPNSHFTIKEIGALTEDTFLALVRERLKASARYKDHALIFIHGYNTSFDFALYRTAQIAYDLKFDGAPFAYSWPSGAGLSSYTYDRESSGQAEPYLKEFVNLVVEKSGAKSVSIIAHSMGNNPTLEVLRDLKAAVGDRVALSEIILAAPDVDRDNFENIATGLKGLSKGITLYAASNDRALKVSRNFYGGIPRAGDVPEGGPVILPGIDTIDVTAASMDSLGLNHSGYAENNALLSDIGLLIQTGERPPASRTPILEPIATPKGTYWRYPKGR